MGASDEMAESKGRCISGTDIDFPASVISSKKNNADGHTNHHIIYVNKSQTINILIPTGSSEHYAVLKS